MDGYVSNGRAARTVVDLARWWNSATQEARFALLRAAVHGEAQAPNLRALQLAIYLAEAEAGEVEKG